MSTSRRLAAILAADVAGYSRLMGTDEEGTLARLKKVRAEIVHPSITRHHGRIFKTTGDGVLVEFASVVAAVRSAVEVQRALAEHNGEIPDDQRLRFRIGIHVGDVIIDDGDVYGDGVNVAARLENLAEPGGICVSARVHEDCAGRINVEFEDRGDQTLKNISRPMHVYRIHLGTTAARSQAVPLKISPALRNIGYVGVGLRPLIEDFRRALAAYGHVDGETIKLHYRWSEGVYSRYPGLLRELIELPVELIVADATPAVAAAKAATADIPIVMVGVGDPIAYGIVPSLMRPGGNITGMSGGLYTYLPRTLRLVKEIIPEAMRVGILAPTTFDHPGVAPAVKSLEDAAHTLDMIPRAIHATTAEELRAALAGIDRRTDVLAVIPDHAFVLNRALILASAAAARCPVLCPSPEYVPDGGLISLGPNRIEVHRRLAYFVDSILRGTPPCELPVEEPSKDWLLINLRTARTLGINIPGPILRQADEVFE
jgi:class 3 adenylate cyclase/ABC-type uncharacterized transport system substrate-binding protein